MALRIFTTVLSAELFYSVLKRIKNVSRFMYPRQTLSSLGMQVMERKLAKTSTWVVLSMNKTRKKLEKKQYTLNIHFLN